MSLIRPFPIIRAIFDSRAIQPKPARGPASSRHWTLPKCFPTWCLCRWWQSIRTNQAWPGQGPLRPGAGQAAQHGALLIGVGWQVQKLVGEIPRDSWDVPLDGFASPEGWRCSGEG